MWKLWRSIWFGLSFLIPFQLLNYVLLLSQSSTLGENAIKRGFWIEDDMFWKDSEPFQILGGDIHYFRVHPQYWEDRMLRAKALGLNTIQTYVAWNVHEPRQGEIYFDGFADVESYLKLAQRLDLLVMLRIGPYICAEWDLGGFPAWLLSYQPPLRLRSSDPRYLDLVDNWWDILLPKVAPLLYINGGPIIMLQVENEFGSYGKDEKYLEHLVRKAREHLGDSTILYTTDGGSEDLLNSGTLQGDLVYSAVDFSTDQDPTPIFALQKKYNAHGKSPALTTEFYTGWLTHWSEKFAHTDPRQTATALDTILSMNASVVLYMAHGGTNFGFSSGANTGRDASDYEPDLTSYDYDAPIREAGDVENAKFKALQTVFRKYSHVHFPDPPPLPFRKDYGFVKLEKIASLFDLLEHVSEHTLGKLVQEPVTMESLNQTSGFLLYRATRKASSKQGSILSIPMVHDRAQVFVRTYQEGGESGCHYLGTINRWSNQPLVLPNNAATGLKLDILVENMGRVNYGHYLFDPKGLLSSVFLDGDPVLGWTVYPIPLDDLSAFKSAVNSGLQDQTLISSKISKQLDATTTEKWTRNILNSSGNSCNSIGFYKGLLLIDYSEKPADTFLSLKGWTKGLVFLNGFNLGRFWPVVGPQCTLYIPAPLLHNGENELILIELERPQMNYEVEFVEKPDFACGPRPLSLTKM